jgi:hypothetical protein
MLRRRALGRFARRARLAARTDLQLAGARGQLASPRRIHTVPSRYDTVAAPGPCCASYLDVVVD